VKVVGGSDESGIAAETRCTYCKTRTRCMHPLRRLFETGPNTLAQIAALLAENAVFHSAVLVRPVEGREKVAAMFFMSHGVRQGTYIEEYRLDDRTTFLRWKGTIHGHEFESFEVLTDNDQGLLIERSVAYRPFPAARMVRQEMYADLRDVLGPDYWEYPAEDRVGIEAEN
jgi:hypothetical protein